mmetsp:Transcript_22677/g.47318  ORF Transcript_22677/g.47318 Transcript_22677/m.47318 type:complete len:119 (+) Transcript_22677:121-477(+)
MQFLAGMAIAMAGAWINLTSDAILRGLRAQRQLSDHDSGYEIPQNGFFRLVSTPHYFGEIIEWVGFAIACQGSLPSIAFAIYTASNLIPRGVAQHAWYKSHFGDKYPKERKAVVPFLW